MGRTTVETAFRVDVRRLVRARVSGAGTLRYGHSAVGFLLSLADADVVLEWTQRGVSYAVRVALETTVPNFGGRRWWACCPRCSRRVAIVYLAPWATWAGVVGCRRCLNLAHEVTREIALYRAMRRVREHRARHGYGGNLAEPIRTKPPGMHLTTFLRFIERDRALMRPVSVELGAWVGMMERLLSKRGY